MTGGDDAFNSGRVTTREFYDAQLETNAKIEALATAQSDAYHAMERRIMAELKGVPKQVETNTKEIDKLRARSNIYDGAVVLVGLLGNAIAATIGWNK